MVYFNKLGISTLEGEKKYDLHIVTKGGRENILENTPDTDMKEEVMYESGKTLTDLRRLANIGDSEAMAALGALYLDSGKELSDIKLAHKYFEQAAAKGNARGINGLGLLYQYGDFVEKDEKKAFKLFKIASEKGFSRAYRNLASCYAQGIGTDPDIQKAIYYYEEAVKKALWAYTAIWRFCSVWEMY